MEANPRLGWTDRGQEGRKCSIAGLKYHSCVTDKKQKKKNHLQMASKCEKTLNYTINHKK